MKYPNEMKDLIFGWKRKHCLNFHPQRILQCFWPVTTKLTKILPVIGCLGSLGGRLSLWSLRITARLVGDPIAGWYHFPELENDYQLFRFQFLQWQPIVVWIETAKCLVMLEEAGKRHGDKSLEILIENRFRLRILVLNGSKEDYHENPNERPNSNIEGMVEVVADPWEGDPESQAHQASLSFKKQWVNL